jgi:hypothetical protein
MVTGKYVSFVKAFQLLPYVKILQFFLQKKIPIEISDFKEIEGNDYFFLEGEFVGGNFSFLIFRFFRFKLSLNSSLELSLKTAKTRKSFRL